MTQTVRNLLCSAIILSFTVSVLHAETGDHPAQQSPAPKHSISAAQESSLMLSIFGGQGSGSSKAWRYAPRLRRLTLSEGSAKECPIYSFECGGAAYDCCGTSDQCLEFCGYVCDQPCE
jgi:hypothetical protein